MSQRDSRLEKVKTITIDWDTFKKTLKRNYLDPDYERQRQNRSYVLQLYPPFEATMEARYYVSEQGRHYDSDWDEKPVHLKPELFILESTGRSFRLIVEYPTAQNTRNALRDEEIEEMGGIEEAVAEGRELFWDELKTILPEQVNIGQFIGGHTNYPVDVEWTNLDD
jgi:hypothetical protein